MYVEFEKQLRNIDDVGFYELQETFEKLSLTSFEQLVEGPFELVLADILDKNRLDLWHRIIQLIQHMPYDTSYSRRSYRAPHSPMLHSRRLIELLQLLIHPTPILMKAVFTEPFDTSYVRYESFYVDKKGEPLISQTLFSYCLALLLNEGDVETEQYVQDILWKNGAHNLFGRPFIRGIVMSENVAMYEQLANVLKADKNQEGVRQAIVEAIDEGTLAAQLYFMNILIEGNFSRFSSVARAVDVWFGLGYETKDQKNIVYSLETGFAALQDEQFVEQLLTSKSSLDVYIGIWAMACHDVEAVVTRTPQLMKQSTHIQHTTLYALRQMNFSNEVAPVLYPFVLQTSNLDTFVYGFSFLAGSLPRGHRYVQESVEMMLAKYIEEHPWLKENTETLVTQMDKFAARIKGERHEIDGAPFPFLHWVFDKASLTQLKIVLLAYRQENATLAAMVEDIPKMSVDERAYFYEIVPVCTDSLSILLHALKDRSSTIRKDTITLLTEKRYPLAQFKEAVVPLLTQKSGEMRQALIKLLSQQPIEEIESLAEELLVHKKEMIRTGGLELLLAVKDQLTDATLPARIVKPTSQEKVLIAQLRQQEDSFINQALAPVHYVVQPDQMIYFTFKDFIHFDVTSLRDKLQTLQQLIAEYAEYKYTVKSYMDELHEVLIGEQLRTQVVDDDMIGSIDQLPLAEIWTDWLLYSELTAIELYCYMYLQEVSDRYYEYSLNDRGCAFLKAYLAGVEIKKIYEQLVDGLYAEQIKAVLQFALAQGTEPLQQQVIQHFKQVQQDFDYVTFCSSMLVHFVQTEDNISDVLSHSSEPSTASDIYLFHTAFSEMSAYVSNREQLAQLFYTNEQFSNVPLDVLKHLSVKGLLLAFDEGFIEENHIRQLLLTEDFCHLLRDPGEKMIKKAKRGKEFQAIIVEVSNYIIEQELTRGEMETPVSTFVVYLGPISGITRFIAILKALGNEKLSRQWTYSANVRKDSLSMMLGKIMPDSNESDELVFDALKEANFEPKRLIEAMLYNTALIPLLSRFIGWEGLENVAWYFIAHTTENTNDFEKAQISEYSAVAIEDFEQGAFDRNWFLNAYYAMKPEHFPIVYDAAKYSTSGSNHRRAQMYAKASLGQLEANTLRQEIVAKRNQDKLRAYSLLPITHEEAKERYLFFQQFVKESKQFGAQRRASEKLAVKMAIQNLAKQVAGGNITQFMWQMEHGKWQDVKRFFAPIAIEDVTIQLVQKAGKVDIHVTKNEKILKSIPAKLKKHETVLAIQQAKKDITAQYQRAKQQLEAAMCEETLFDSAIVQELLHNDNLQQLFISLVWKQGEQCYYIDQGQFCTLSGERVDLIGDVQLAHPADFYQQRSWRAWQHFIFEKGWQQPFKQVFREFYIATAEEHTKTATNRFGGYQVQPNKAIALLKSRSWQAGYYEPLRKISYHYNLVTTIDFVSEYFTAAEVEAPTLRAAYFTERLTGKACLIEHIPAIYFSEVMRDLDLVVSVAHAGEVDPEASHSTIEMRSVIAEEVVVLMGLTNVRVQVPNILIDGQLGKYSIHLGSGNVHQLGGTMIPVISVPSQHRGRVFLPFVDEDPKTVEICSKLLLFAQDEHINDPQIRGYIVQQ